ncbi:BglG family transcription antiterminator [Peribacillus sp. FSL E2-0218]|uniref:BglG family transcription antiterminator n=1 Tax=Peribacillus sp. FSL E2-0218 TaxID=2921364 RepID=UPI0030EC49EE
MFSTREQKLLRYLMQADKEMTGLELAGHLHITSRTIRSMIKNLTAILEEHGAEIIAKHRKGYQLHIHDHSAFRSFLKIVAFERVNEQWIPNDPSDRITFLIKRLLLSEDYIKLEMLADELYVSLSTVKNSLKEVRELLTKYELVVYSRPNYGLKVVGSELKIRFCIAEYVFNTAQKTTELVADPEMAAIRSIILKQTKRAGIQLSDIGLSNLVIHIAIACKRVLLHNYVSMLDEEIKNFEEQAEYLVSKQIVTDIEKSFNVTFPDSEVAYVTLRLLGTKMVSYTKANDPLYPVNLISEEILTLTANLIDQVENELQLCIHDDQELIHGLGLHLKPAINRHYHGMNIRNPLLAEIKQKYPLAFDAGVVMSKALHDSLGVHINEDEIGYLALHIEAAMERKRLKPKTKRCVIVCATGVASSQLLYYKLKSAFESHLDIAGTMNLYELRNYPLESLDFIISTIPIYDDLSIPVVDVNTLLGNQDILHIEAYMVDHITLVLDYTDPELMYFQKDLQTREEVFDFFEAELTKLGRIPAGFKEAVIEREKVSPTCYGNLVAIPHPMHPLTKETFWSVLTLKKPIAWGEEMVQYICLLSVQKEYEDEMQKIYQFLVKVIETKALVDQLIKVERYADFEQVIKRMEEYGPR